MIHGHGVTYTQHYYSVGLPNIALIKHGIAVYSQYKAIWEDDTIQVEIDKENSRRMKKYTDFVEMRKK